MSDAAIAKPIEVDGDPPRYRWPFTVADQVIVDSLDERTRDAVERYARSFGIAPAAKPTELEESQLDDLAERIADGIDLSWEIRSSVREAFDREQRNRRKGAAEERHPK